MTNSILRGEIFFVMLDPVVGHAMGAGKERPVVVISINAIHQKTGIAAVVPGTTKKPAYPYANVVRVAPDSDNNLKYETYFQCHQIRAIDELRMTSSPVGRLEEGDFRKIVAAAWKVLGWPLGGY